MPTVDAFLKREFASRHVDAAIVHFQAAVGALGRDDWEEAIAKAGKFIEALCKCLWLRAGKTLPPGRQFKVGNVITGLRQLPAGTLDDNIRITVPRACEFVYDIASNRGARHDPDEVNPNEMDATVAVSTCSWIFAEVVRYTGRGTVSFSEVSDLVSALIERRFPFVETVDSRTYFHVDGASAREIALLALWKVHPARMAPSELVEAVTRHRFSRGNAQQALSRLRGVVDADSAGNLRLLRPGIHEAERIMARQARRGV
jgi:hypothetical protein